MRQLSITSNMENYQFFGNEVKIAKYCGITFDGILKKLGRAGLDRMMRRFQG